VKLSKNTSLGETISKKITIHDIENELKTKKFLYLGKSKDHVPSFLCIASLHDPSKSKYQDTLNVFIYFMEHLDRFLEEGNETVNFVFDFGGWGFTNYDGKLLKELINTMEQNYPERLENCYVINCPLWFNAVWKKTKGRFSEDSLKRITWLTKKIGKKFC